jgi:CheY-like chemotaxis protein
MKSSVLIVENERATAWALSEGLAEDGYKIKAVQSSEEALRFLRRGKCDLIITDIHLPGMDGIGLLRKVSSKKQIPAIVITASGSQEILTEARRAGAVQRRKERGHVNGSPQTFLGEVGGQRESGKQNSRSSETPTH